MLADGPAVLTLLEIVTTALVARGLDPDATDWDAWRNEDGRWTVRLTWQVGRSENVAHFRFAPGAHGGTVTACDEPARELIDPDYARPPLRPVAAVAELEFDEAAPPAPAPQDPPETPEPEEQPAAEVAKPRRTRRSKARPTVPAWEDVLLGVRSSSDR